MFANILIVIIIIFRKQYYKIQFIHENKLFTKDLKVKNFQVPKKKQKHNNSSIKKNIILIEFAKMLEVKTKHLFTKKKIQMIILLIIFNQFCICLLKTKI